MWHFCGDIECTCENCGYSDLIPISYFDNECYTNKESYEY